MLPKLISYSMWYYDYWENQAISKFAYEQCLCYLNWVFNVLYIRKYHNNFCCRKYLRYDMKLA